MKLIGQYDSPFVRRVGIALTLYGQSFEHLPWSCFGDADRIRPHNPLTRVPVLVLDGGESLIESHMILDYLDGLMPPARRLFPQTEPDRRRALQRAALACGIGDKAVSLFYEMRLHSETSGLFVARCKRQIGEGLARLEAFYATEPAAPVGPDIGPSIGHAEIALAAVWRFTHEAHPGLIDDADLPALSALCDRLEATAAFRAICQSFIPPA